MAIIDFLCKKLCKTFPNRVRVIKRYGQPYLLRFYITSPRTAQDSDDELDENFGVYLHYFFEGDQDVDLHNHPWSIMVSYILSGGYLEERLVNDKIVSIVRKPGRFNVLFNNTFHRVTLYGSHKPVWTLFLVCNRKTRWGFRDRKTQEYIDFAEYLEDFS